MSREGGGGPSQLPGRPTQQNPSSRSDSVHRQQGYAPPTTPAQDVTPAATNTTGLAASQSVQQLQPALSANLCPPGLLNQGNVLRSQLQTVSPCVRPRTLEAALMEAVKRNAEISNPAPGTTIQGHLRPIEAKQKAPATPFQPFQPFQGGAVVQATTRQKNSENIERQLQLARQIRLKQSTAAPELFASRTHASESVEVAGWAERRCERLLKFLEEESKDLQRLNLVASAKKHGPLEVVQRVKDDVIRPILDSGSPPRVCLERLETALCVFLKDQGEVMTQVESLYGEAITEQKERIARLEKEEQQDRRGEMVGEAVRPTGRRDPPAQGKNFVGSDALGGIQVSNQFPPSVSDGGVGATGGAIPLHAASNRTERNIPLTSGPSGDGYFPNDVNEFRGDGGKAGSQSVGEGGVTPGACEPGVTGTRMKKRKIRPPESAVVQRGHDALTNPETEKHQRRHCQPRLDGEHSSKGEIPYGPGTQDGLASSSQSLRISGPSSRSTPAGFCEPRASLPDVAVAGLGQALPLRRRQVGERAASSNEAARSLPSVQPRRSRPAAEPGLGRSPPVRGRYTAAGEEGLKSGAGPSAGSGLLTQVSVLGAVAQANLAGAGRGPQASEANTGVMVAAGNTGADEGRIPRREDPKNPASVGTPQADQLRPDYSRREAQRLAQNTYRKKLLYNTFPATIALAEKNLAAKIVEKANVAQSGSATRQDRKLLKLLDRDIADLSGKVEVAYDGQEEAKKQVELAMAQQQHYRDSHYIGPSSG